MKLKKFICILLAAFSCLFVVVLASCNDSGQGSGDNANYTLNDVIFENKEFDYDGTAHSIYADKLPAGATVTYTNNDQIEPGVYQVGAIIKTTTGSKKKKIATMTINKVASTLSAEASQVAYSTTLNERYSYTLDNDEQTVVAVVKKAGQVATYGDLFKNGVYSVELYAKASKHYKESNHVNITLTVKSSEFDVSFEDATIIADGTEKTIELTGTLPTGYTVDYANNKATEPGTYYASAEIKNASGTVVETHRAVLVIDTPVNKEFNDFMDEFLVDYIEGDQYAVNIFFSDSTSFGIERCEAHWYEYSSITDNDQAETLKFYQDALKNFTDRFNLNNISVTQYAAYNKVYSFYKEYVDKYSIKDYDFKNNHYIDQFGGYVAEFGSALESYKLRVEQDVQDLIDYIDSTETAFPSYLVYLADKTKKGYALSDYTITEMINYLKEILDSQPADGSSHYYLQDVLFEHIDAVTFLTDTQKASYKNRVEAAIAEKFIPAVKTLHDGLAEYIGKLSTENEGYWAAYPDGKDIFTLELESLLGLNDFNIEGYIEEVNLALIRTSSMSSSALQNLISKYNITTQSQLDALIAGSPICKGTPAEMMIYLKEFAKTIVPDLKSTPEIVFKNMDDATAKVSNAVAYYTKSPLDSTDSEYITLNTYKLTDSNDILSTLAHEGYPGHLYAYVYNKELNISNLEKIMTNTAHAEGWATYVSLQLFEYAIENATDEKAIDVLKYLYYQELSSFLFETRSDVGVHVQGWDVKQLAAFMDQLGYDSSMAKDIYDLLIETPASYASYGYGKYFFVKLHDDAKKILGIAYDEVEFNAMLLSKGWTSLGELENTYIDYMQKKCHKLGIDFEA